MIELVMRPDLPPMTGEDFRTLAGPYSIALDGFVREGPWFDPIGPYRCFNHHEGVSRLDTRSTTGQVQLSLRQGLYQCFRDGSGPRAQVWVNDNDEDVCMAWFQLKHPHLATQVMNPMLNRLVHMVDMLDTTAGAYPFPEDLDALHQLAWVFEPYRQFRFSGEITKRNPSAFLSVITDVEHRIMANVTGQGRTVAIDTTYKAIITRPSYVVVREVGTQARLGMFANGIRAFVSSSERPDGRWSHTVGRMSDYIDFPVLAILHALNVEEGMTGIADRWGGGNTIGGAPRIQGSRLNPVQVAAIIDDTIDRLRLTRP